MVMPKKDTLESKKTKSPKKNKDIKKVKHTESAKTTKTSKITEDSKVTHSAKNIKTVKRIKPTKEPKKATTTSTVSKSQKLVTKEHNHSKNDKNVNTVNSSPKKHIAEKTAEDLVQSQTQNDITTADIAVTFDQSKTDNKYIPYTDDEILEKNASVYQLYWRWSNFELKITEPNTFDIISPPNIIMPAVIDGTSDLEFVYPIHDFGNMLSTSKGDDLYESGMSMCKLFFTIEKMIYLLVQKIDAGGIDKTTNVHVEFDGHELSQRKAFESVINLSYNVVVTNFDPGSWGDKYLNMVKSIGERGYSYPEKSPRYESYHRSFSSGSTIKKPS